MKLTDATPTSIQPMGDKGWCISFGEAIVGREVGTVYLLSNDPYYVRFLIVQGEKTPLYQPVSKRPLTDEEAVHFERLVKEREI